MESKPNTPPPRPFLEEMQGKSAGTIFHTWCLLRKNEKRVSRANGKEFLTLELADRTLSVFSTIFSDQPLFQKLPAFEVGSILKIEASVDYYNDKFSPRLIKAALLPKEEWSEDIQKRLVRSTQFDPEVMFADVLAAIDSIQDGPLQQTLLALFNGERTHFCHKPAARGIHHAFRGGLLEHTWSMLQVAQRLLPHYKELNHDLVISGILLHDFGKIVEYGGELDTERTRDGILLGHAYTSCQRFEETARIHGVDTEIRTQVVHVILSHHRMPEWGALVRPATPEALFVSMVDGMDSLMGIVDNARHEHKGSEKTPYLPAIENYLIWPRIPEPVAEQTEQAKAKPEAEPATPDKPDEPEPTPSIPA